MIEPLPHSTTRGRDDELRQLRSTVLRLGERVDRAITRSVGALLDRDVDACGEVVADDAEITGLQQEVRILCFTYLLTGGLEAGELREVLGFLDMSAELEGMGEQCVSIATLGRNLADLPAPYVEIAGMGNCCSERLREVLAALMSRDADRARRMARGDERAARIHRRIIDELTQLMGEDRLHVHAATSLAFVAHHLEKVADRVTHLAEDLLWLETGGTEERPHRHRHR